ncbi:MAG: tripartite tricarboxylate transporter substrate binding protein [Betaproteobacteria bacterium]
MKTLLRALSAALLAGTAVTVCAQAWPSKPVRIIAPYAAGGTNDIAARILAERLSQRLGQQLVVENKPGANTRIATEYVAKSAPDGYTLFFCAAPHSTNPGLYDKLPYDTVKDFAPVVQAVTVPLFFLVPAASPAKNARDLIDLAKKDPAYANIGSPGNGSAPHLAIELLNAVAGVSLVHIPYKGDAPAIQDLLGGRLGASVDPVAPALPHIKAGKLRAISVASPQRYAGLPDVPTLAEQGFRGAEAFAWFGLLTPAGTPADVIARLNAEVNAALKLPEVSDKLVGLGMTPVGGTPEQFGAFIRADIDKWTKLIRSRGIKPD